MGADFIARGLFDFIRDDLLVDHELAGQIDASINTFIFNAFLCHVFCFRFTLVPSVCTDVVEEAKAS